MSKHKLSLSYVVAISVSSMLYGVFILPGMAYSIAGPGLIAAYFVASFFALIAVFSKAEVTSAMPTTASAYFYVARSFGSGVGMTYGLLTWLSLALKSAVALLAVATFSSLFFQADPRIIAIVLTVLLTILNIVGIRQVGKMQMILGLLVGGLLLYLVWQGTGSIEIMHYKGFLSSGSSGIFAAAGFIFVSYAGLLKVASVAEEIENPGRNVPKGMIISLVFITIIYISVVFVTIGVVSPDALAGSLRPISLLAVQIGGSAWGKIVAIGAILAIISATNAGIMAASRYPMAIANDDMLPKS
ncbi:amino acid permease, partial [bacterium]|nr:amino acid permease [bacterium]